MFVGFFHRLTLVATLKKTILRRQSRNNLTLLQTDLHAGQFRKSRLAIPSQNAKEPHSFLFFILVCGTFAFCPHAQKPFSIVG